MPENTLEGLADRVAALEKKLDAMQSTRPAKDWRNVVGMFEGSEFMRKVDAEVEAIRAAERKAAAEGADE